MKYEIKRASKGDFESIVQLLDSANLPTQDLLIDPVSHFLICRDGTQIIGCIGLEIYEKHGLVRSLVIDETSRNLGVGAQLVYEVEAYANQNGLSNVYLLTTSAQRFFQLRKYEVIERGAVPMSISATQQFSAICPDSATCMHKKLGQDVKC